jgi:hypothetical protein
MFRLCRLWHILEVIVAVLLGSVTVVSAQEAAPQDAKSGVLKAAESAATPATATTQATEPSKDVPAKESATPPADACATVAEQGSGGFDWSVNPRPSPLSKVGFFPILPTGPGYYSLLDVILGNYRENPPRFGYPRHAVDAQPFFDADFRYVDKSDSNPDFLERLHRIHIGDNFLVATGGEFRLRYFNEVNSRLSGKDNNYELYRLRVFGDVWYQDRLRLYVEFIDAQDVGYNRSIAPLLIDRDFGDLLNAFVDVKLFTEADGTGWYLRGGRQELALGSQRMVSSLDWANTKRTFDGVRLLRHGEDLDFDLWWARPVIPNPTQFDHNDAEQTFVGAWTQYRPNKLQAIDLYYMYLDNSNVYNLVTKTPAPVGAFPVAPYTVSTLGYRYSGSTQFNKNILFDSENAIQFGHTGFAHAGLVAGASTTGLGYNFSEAPMNPTVWAYFDYASGSADLKSGQLSTFNQLYPFGHYYFGNIDYIGRQNILDWNFHGYLYPTNWITLNAQLHVLSLASAHDALYNASGQIQRYDPTGKAGRSVGEELTFVSNFHLTKRQDIFVAYSHLIEGRFLQQTGPGRSAETFWLMYNVRW